VRRLYSEHVPFEVVGDPALLRTLAAHAIELAVAVFPDQHEAAADLARRVAACDVPLVLWPLLGDRQGRWPNGTNHEAFEEHAERLAARVPGTPPAKRWLDISSEVCSLRMTVCGAKLSRVRSTRVKSTSAATCARTA